MHVLVSAAEVAEKKKKAWQYQAERNPKFLREEKVVELLLSKFESVAAQGYNWDDANGLPIRPDVFEFAVDNLFVAGSHINLDLLPEPTVTPVSDGTVVVSFAWAGRKLVIRVACEDVVNYVRIFADGQTTVQGEAIFDWEDDEDATSMLLEIREALDWLVGGERLYRHD